MVKKVSHVLIGKINRCDTDTDKENLIEDGILKFEYQAMSFPFLKCYVMNSLVIWNPKKSPLERKMLIGIFGSMLSPLVTHLTDRMKDILWKLYDFYQSEKLKENR